MGMQNGNITKAYYPFWIGFELCKIQLINYPYQSVAPSRTHNCFDIRFNQHVLQIFCSFLISTSK